MLYSITFSPTGGTRKVADTLAEGIGLPTVPVELCLPKPELPALSADDVCLIALPSFGGRVPGIAARKLALLQGKGARAILVCVYGNRAYEDTLAEMEDLAAELGFITVGAVAAIAEHSIMHCYAAGRPDRNDRAELHRFGVAIASALSAPVHCCPVLPGCRPYKKSGPMSMVPQVSDRCVMCGLCAGQCPTGAIDPNCPNTTTADLCAACTRCVAICPTGARTLNPDIVAAITERMRPVCEIRKDNELFL